MSQRTLITILLIFISIHQMHARQLHWLPTIGDWDDGQNWSLSAGGAACSCVPGNGDTASVLIVGSIANVPDGFIAKASQIQIGFSSTVQVGTSLGSNASLSVADSELGFAIYGTLRTYGTVNVNRTSRKGIFIAQGGHCIIEAGGTIDIHPAFSTIDSLLCNEGNLTILSSIGHGDGRLLLKEAKYVGLLSSGSMAIVSNQGVIEIDSTLIETSVAIQNDDESEFNNLGTIDIHGGNGLGVNNDHDANFNNENTGSLTCTGLENTAFRVQSGQLKNQGTLNFIDCAMSGLSLARRFVNEGSIVCHDVAGAGIVTILTLENKGVITIAESSTGLLVAFDSLLNDGEINISNVVTGIAVQEAGSLFRNDGFIGLSEVFTGLSLSCHFENFDTCSIQDFTGAAISSSQSQLLSNHGLLTMRSNLTGTALALGSSEFFNACTGQISASPTLSLGQNSQLNNRGYIHLDVGLINSTGATIINEGIISDQQNALMNVVLTGDGILLGPLYGFHSIGIPSHGIIKGNVVDFTYNNQLFYSEDLTTPAGTYNVMQNTWTPASPAGLNIVYHDISNACTDFAVIQPVVSPVSTTCPEPAPINMLVEDGTWQSHDRWTLQQIPTFCHAVQIETGKTVVITISEIAHARTIEIEDNGFFEVYGELEVKGNN